MTAPAEANGPPDFPAPKRRPWWKRGVSLRAVMVVILLIGGGLGHLIGWPRLDDWLMRRFWLGPEFTDMVLGTRLDVRAVARAALRRPEIHTIWRGLGYCILGTAPHE